MKITIVPDDGVVGVDKVFREVDLSALSDVHAVQFDTDLGAGHEELKSNVNNELDLETFGQKYTTYIDLWNAAAPPVEPPYIPTADDLIKQQIAELEATVTQRRLREALLGQDGGWLAQTNAQIANLRSQLV